MTTFTWTINQMERLTADGFVVKVNFSVLGVDGDYSASYVSDTTYEQKKGETYTPYDQLTEQQVIGWVQNSLQEKNIDAQADVQARIDLQKNPPVSSGMPWYVPPAPTPLA